MSRLTTLKRLFQCLGLSSLVLLVNYKDLLNGGEGARMHVPYSLRIVGAALLTDIVVLGLLFFAFRMAVARTRFYPWARLLVVIFVPPYLIERSRTLIPFEIQDTVLIALSITWAVLVLSLFLLSPRAFRIVVRIGDFMGIFAAVFCLCSVAQIVAVMTWTPGPHQIQAAWASTPQPPRHHPRVVWIVFDELSYDQLFAHRAHDLAAPHFDSLRAQSTLYTDVQPAGYKTVVVIPSLLTGRIIDRFHFRFDNRMSVHYADNGRWAQVSGAPTLFEDARRAGWRTAVVGWYNPYCTVYRSALDSCYWTDLDAIGMDTAEGQSFWPNARRPFHEIGLQLLSPARESRMNCSFEIGQRIQSLVDLEQHTDAVLSQDQADFLFIHLPIPHPPSIWSRQQNHFVHTCGSSYVDNLALADIELGRLMKLLQQSPRWKDTTLIVEGDHSWRVPLWDWLPDWTDEDERTSGGRFDPRPALLIHNAGETQPQVEGRPVPLVNVHQAMEDVLRGAPAQMF